MKDKKLYRSNKDKKLFGVCGGIAEYFEIDSTVVRLGAIFLAFCVGGGVFAYLIAALVMPEEPSKKQIYMSIVNLKDIEQLENIIGNNLVKLGDGHEGVSYLSLNDNKVYKLIQNEEFLNNIEDIITSSHINLKYFLLPEELYVYNNHLLAYKTKYIKKDLLNKDNKDNNIFKIDFDKFIIAYKNILEEIKTLSENKIKIYDIGLNLLFDGENLYAIDTCGYKKVEEEKNEIYRCNKIYLEEAIKEILTIYMRKDLSLEEYDKLVEINDLEEQLNKIKKSIKR